MLVLGLLLFEARPSLALSIIEPPQFEWELELGSFYFAVEGNSRNTLVTWGASGLHLGDRTTVFFPLSGWASLTCIGLLATTFCASVFYFLWRRTQARPPATPTTDR